MIRPDALGELKDGAAGLVALSELFASRRVGPKAIAASLASVVEACTAVEAAAETLARDAAAVVVAHPPAAAELRALHDRSVAGVRALAGHASAAAGAPIDARARLVLERAAQEACGHLAAGLFAGELLAAASAPRPVMVRVADVLGFGPVFPEGPLVVSATLDAAPEAVATTDPRLLRALVELCVQIVATAGVARPHVEVAARQPAGARIRIGARAAVEPISVRSGVGAPISVRSSAGAPISSHFGAAPPSSSRFGAPPPSSSRFGAPGPSSSRSGAAPSSSRSGAAPSSTRSGAGAGPSSSRAGAATVGASALMVRKLPWSEGARDLMCAAAQVAGVAAWIDAAGRSTTLDLP